MRKKKPLDLVVKKKKEKEKNQKQRKNEMPRTQPRRHAL